MPSYDEIVQQNLNYAKVCTSQQKKLEKLKEKLNSSQETYKILLEQYDNFANLNVKLSTKIEQLKASAITNEYTINDEQLVKKKEKLKEKLASSQDAYKSLLAKMKTMCKHYDELTNKVAKLEAVSTTPTKASKKKSSIFNMPKNDSSTSYNYLCLDLSLCNQVCVEKIIVDTRTQRGCKGE